MQLGRDGDLVRRAWSNRTCARRCSGGCWSSRGDRGGLRRIEWSVLRVELAKAGLADAKGGPPTAGRPA